ncbi:UBP-type zinc finger domain-containing protein [Agromyces silvae]|uniref:UBP-type zinc finger domain-containing protein n=1 Tax=Agromyces silvae TaxID=3388266 RepID=UPI00280AA174|nr:UBP-type zinc finger domain-containing protein [Agromyces protaetiae]
MTPLAPAPSGTGCVDCVETGGWWLHLRRCVECGHVGCCDSSPSQHASGHARDTGHPVAASFEPGEGWFWNYATGTAARPVPLTPPRWRPEEQECPGPNGSVPEDWQSRLH